MKPHYRIQTREVAIAAVLRTVSLRSACDQNPVATFFSTASGYRAQAQTVVECVIPHDWYYFSALKDEWDRERRAMSSLTQIYLSYPYQQIIAMGDNALPFIFSELKKSGKKPEPWFWALRVITHENPVQPQDRGNFPKMAAAWLDWANTHSA